MNARMPLFRFRRSTLAVLIAALGLGQLGCWNSSEDAGPDETAYLASGGLPPGSDPQRREAQPGQQDVSESTPPVSPEMSPQSATPRAAAAEQSPEGNAATPFTIEGAGPPRNQKVPRKELGPDLSKAQLLDVIAGADKDMQVIVTGRSGITDPNEARDTLMHIIKIKMEASRRLANHANADASARSEGARGELQSLSHLASLGDLKSAVELEKIANANLESEDAKLVADSRLVLIGFAIESLGNGDEAAADDIVFFVDQIASTHTPDVAALMVMGQARETLVSYGHEDKAKHVRDTIIDLFADSPEPDIARLAAQVAGNVRFDAIEKLRGGAIEGESVTGIQWREAVETLIDESADLQTVQYLAGAALEFESFGLNELVDETYDVLQRSFDDTKTATGQEVQLAIAASRARREVVGQAFDYSLPQVDGSSLDAASYEGKVVLMPFWAMGFPESLQLVPRLKTIRESDPDNVTIVGVNLDAEGAPVAEFLTQNDLGFPCLRAESSATAKVANPIAAKFGMVSMPFVAILDREGRVASINFTGRQLEETVKELVGP